MRFSNEDLLQISDLSQILGITARTIRLYEKMGLVEHPKRTSGKIRYYEKEDVKRFKFVQKLKALGLSLEEGKELAALFRTEQNMPERIMPRLIEVLDVHLNSIRQKVLSLQSLERDITVYHQKIIDYLTGNNSPSTMIQHVKKGDKS